MNAHRKRHTLSYVERSLVILLIAAIGLALAFTQPAAAQGARPQVLAAQFFDAVNGNGSLALANPNAVLHSPEGEFLGRAGIAEFGAGLHASFSDLEFATQSVEAVDHLVIVRFALTGTNTGGYHDVAANHAGFAVPGVAVLRIGEEGVVEQWIGYDSHWIVNQLLAFNQFDPNIIPANRAGQAQVPDAPAYEPPPTCLSPNECETAW